MGQLLSKEILIKANDDLKSKPITVTSFQSERSAGGVHDFFSEADYWWPDALNPSGPYIQKDGQTNPANFSEHRLAMIRFSQMVGNLTSAYLLTNDNKYAVKAIQHCKAWFVDTATKMTPSLLYAQAIKGKVTGRGVGIIDMIQMMEVAQSIMVLEKQNAIKSDDFIEIKKWFQQYLQWVTTHPYGIDEREAKNNHGTCWTMQVAVFAKLVNDTALLNYCDNRFKTNQILPSFYKNDKTINLSTNVFYLLKDSYTIVNAISNMKTEKTMALIELLDHTRLLSPGELAKQVK